MKKYRFFDTASTTKCCDEAVSLLCRFANEDYGNPSSSHALGQASSRAIRDARQFFADTFRVTPEQVIFTGSGSEADNLAIYGTATAALAKARAEGTATPVRVLTSAIEHPAVKKTVESLQSFGVETALIPVDAEARIKVDALKSLLSPAPALVSIMQVNNIVGTIQPVEELAELVKKISPSTIFHTDAIQAFGRVPVPAAPSPVDLVSLSAHKIEGPKGIGALIVLNKSLLKSGLRPLVWGGGQEGGFRSGTQSAGLIAGFHAAAKRALEKREAYATHAAGLQRRLRARLVEKKLLASSASSSSLGPVIWNSPEFAVPHIVNLSVPGYPAGPLARLLEERGCLVSTGSACSSAKAEPDAVLVAMGLSSSIHSSAIRVSFSADHQLEDVDALADALEESITLMAKLLGGGPRGASGGGPRR